jgi:hypothetical protein
MLLARTDCKDMGSRPCVVVCKQATSAIDLSLMDLSLMDYPVVDLWLQFKDIARLKGCTATLGSRKSGSNIGCGLGKVWIPARTALHWPWVTLT